MSEEGDAVMVEATPVADQEVVEEQIDLESALVEVLKKALIVNGLGRGLRECQKALEQGSVHLCILAADCNEPAYVSLITALCLEHGVKLLKVKKAKQLVIIFIYFTHSQDHLTKPFSALRVNGLDLEN